ncbi:MAG: acetyl/propionyl/methylcrotonyl-CoA carboxylase subunit alpha [Acetobacteraceae bacterium]|nr:acetyl/propionyl/methylcrotonyl-CoA carboxylase subunit alpha [Acetobacteraceae bacterium]
MFSKILIANRGEIACRVIRTARQLGIATVAVYSDADAHSMHVAMADEAYHIGAAPARESYLRADAILDVCKRAGAQAVHPGYGFLSENAAFADACAEAGVVFIGPPASSIRAMGGKSEAKALMQQAGVPLVPGYHGEDQSPELLEYEAGRIGYPVLIKASAGGGGKGMRVVREAADFAAELAGAKREALSSFGDERVLIERYLTHPRHVEIQVFADSHGACLYLAERDCSVQRRHQKVIEEAPAPGLSAEMRRAMGEAAVAAARAVGYVGAGTVEFIVEGDSFAFMEMNTRLQVEHPVTEAITGLDLVEWQLRVASGEALPITQDQVQLNGHAFEARLYAEDPLRNFLPSVGRLVHLVLPEDRARIDAGVRSGDEITAFYDPMIAKIITHGPDRAVALHRLERALAACEVVGVQTNLGLLRGIAAEPAFAAGDVETGFIGARPHLLEAAAAPDPVAVAAAALAILVPGAAQADPWAAQDGWQLNLPSQRRVSLTCGDVSFDIMATPGIHGWALTWEGQTVRAESVEGGVRIDGVRHRLTVLRDGLSVVVIRDGVNLVFVLPDLLSPPKAAHAGSGRVLAPIPGRVVSVLVNAGDSVTQGQTLVVLEAMKMELALTAPQDGVVRMINVAAGDMVSDGAELVELAS